MRRQSYAWTLSSDQCASIQHETLDQSSVCSIRPSQVSSFGALKRRTFFHRQCCTNEYNCLQLMRKFRTEAVKQNQNSLRVPDPVAGPRTHETQRRARGEQQIQLHVTSKWRQLRLTANPPTAHDISQKTLKGMSSREGPVYINVINGHGYNVRWNKAW